MRPAAHPIPAGFRTVTPHLVVRGAIAAIDFYRRAFGARQHLVNRALDSGLVVHAQLTLGDSVIMLSDEFPNWGARGPEPGRRTPVQIHLCVEDTDATYRAAVDAGARIELPPQDMFWGDRYAVVADPFGHRWSISTRMHDLTSEEIQERARRALPG